MSRREIPEELKFVEKRSLVTFTLEVYEVDGSYVGFAGMETPLSYIHYPVNGIDEDHIRHLMDNYGYEVMDG